MEKLSPKDLIVIHPSEYFNGLVTGALESLNVRVTEHTKFYLVSLLSNFISAEKLFTKNAEGKLQDPTLALILAEAMKEEGPVARRNRLKQLGDLSLYIAGYFSHSLQNKLVDVDYYIDMGGAAYIEASNIAGRASSGEVFAELGTRFPTFVDVLGQVSEESFINQNASAQDDSLLRIYDLWTKTGSERLAKQLLQAGINPEDLQKKSGKQ